MPDMENYKERAEFIVSNTATSLSIKVNAFLDTIKSDNVMAMFPFATAIGSDGKSYLIGCMIRYWEEINE